MRGNDRVETVEVENKCSEIFFPMLITFANSFDPNLHGASGL